MKKFIMFFVVATMVLTTTVVGFTQNLGVNQTGSAADNSAGLDVDFSNKGFLLPRMTTSERDAISSPALSLQIFNTTTKCLQMYMGSSWVNVVCDCTLPGGYAATAATSITSSGLTANWSASGGASSYRLDVDDDSDFSSPLAGYNDLNVGNVTSYNVTGLTCGSTYYYRVRAVNDCGTAANSNTITTAVSQCFIVATGGTITTDGNFKVHTFNSSGTFQITSGSGDVDYLVIAGGGGGGGPEETSIGGGGGGAGGYLEGTKSSMTTGSYTVTVGAGGAGGISASSSTPAGDGGNSVFDNITASGGGHGGYYLDDINGGLGGSGGSGGGAAAGGAGGTGTVGQGNNGGAGPGVVGNYGGSGGGGAGAAGVAAVATTPGAGGAGKTSSITGTAVTRAGGGGGGHSAGAAGGAGGGGAGGATDAPGSPGVANTGSGGGGGGGNSGTGYYDGGAGGSGVVIVRYQYQ